MPSTAVADRLTPERVVEVAHDLISQHGLEWFSMRKLAAALDVNPMTVYLRFDNKDGLLDAVARHGLARFRPEPPADGPWEHRCAQLAGALRRHLLADRNLLGLYTSAERLSGAVLHAVEQGLDLMEEIGYRDGDAVLAFRTLFWHTVGFSLVDGQFPADSPGGLEAAVGAIDPSTHPTFARHISSFTPVDADELFATATHALVTGLRADAPRPRETSR